MADTAPSAGVPATVSSDALPTVQIDGVAWTQLVVGGTVYVGGSFTRARPAGAAPGVGTSVRSNLLAYDLATGVLRTAFAPSFNGEVRGLAASADGSTIYAVGGFTSVNGQARGRIAAVDASTGAVGSSFKPQANGTVVGISRSGSVLYLAGSFTTISGIARSRAAAVTTSGAVTGFAPQIADYAARAVVVDPTGTKVVLGGSFSTVNGSTSRGTVMVDAATGRSNLPWALASVVRNYTDSSSIMSLSTDGASVYGTGYVYGTPGNLEGAFSASWTGGAVRWVEDCHGDTYSNTVAGGAVYVAGHPHSCANIGGFTEQSPKRYQRALAFSTTPTCKIARNTEGTYPDFGGQPCPKLLTWYPDFNTGTYTGSSQGPWSVASGNGYVVYGGEFTTVNGVQQQGLVRFASAQTAPNRDGPRLAGSAFVPTTSVSGSSVDVRWKADYDRDNERLTYRVYRDGVLVATRTVASRIWFDRPTTTVTDVGVAAGTHTYRVVAADPFGNQASSATVTAVVGAAPSARSGTSPSPAVTGMTG
jgi:hypothetical protein